MTSSKASARKNNSAVGRWLKVNGREWCYFAVVELWFQVSNETSAEFFIWVILLGRF